MDQRNENGSPWWSKSIYTLGPVAIIAIILALVIPTFMSETSKELAGLAGGLQHHAADVKQQTDILSTSIIQASAVSKEAHVRQIEDTVRYLGELKIAHEAQVRLLRQICRNVARSEEARVRCDE